MSVFACESYLADLNISRVARTSAGFAVFLMISAASPVKAQTVTVDALNSTTINSTTINNSGNTKTGTLNVTGASTTTGITNTGKLTNNGDAAIGGKLDVTGATTTKGITNVGLTKTDSLAVGTGGVTVASGSTIDAGGNKINNVGGPIVNTDAANKVYVDDQIKIVASKLCTAKDCVSAGNGANAQDESTTSVGANSKATFKGSTAVGSGAQATADPATALGSNAKALGNNSVALGADTSAAGENSIAVGQGAHADQANAIAIGRGVQTTRANQVAIGSATNTYTLGGLPSAASSAAQSGTTKFVTTDSNGNLAASRYGTADVGKSLQGVAVAIALGGITISPNKKFALAGSFGFFDDKQAFAAQGAYRFAPDWTVSGGLGFGLNESSPVGGRVGIMTEW